MTWMIPFIAACWLLIGTVSAIAANQCRFCHADGVTINSGHRLLACRDCHQSGSQVLSDPASRVAGSAGCVGCHQGYARMFEQAMGSRAKEMKFIQRSYGIKDRDFEQKNCSGCHLQGCQDCHGKGHAISRPKVDSCSKCHKGYFVGWDYFGRAPREEHERYQRGERLQGENILKMMADVHQKRE